MIQFKTKFATSLMLKGSKNDTLTKMTKRAFSTSSIIAIVRRIHFTDNIVYLLKCFGSWG